MMLLSILAILAQIPEDIAAQDDFVDDSCFDCGFMMCPSGNRAICCKASKTCECPENCPSGPEGNICNLYHIYVSMVFYS